MKKYLLIASLLTIPLLSNCGNNKVDTCLFKFASDHCSIDGSYFFDKEIDKGATDIKFTVNLDGGYVVNYDRTEVPDGLSFKDETITIPVMDKDYMITVVTDHVGFLFKFTGINCKIKGDYNYQEYVKIDSEITYDIVSDSGYALSDTDVEIAGDATCENGKIKITKMIGEVYVTATASLITTYQIHFQGSNCLATGGTQTEGSSDFTISRTSDLSNLELYIYCENPNTYRLPDTVSVTFNGSEEGVVDRDYAYDKNEGKLVLVRKENVLIYVEAINVPCVTMVATTTEDSQKVGFTPGGNYTVDWGDGSAIKREDLHTYEKAGTYNIQIYGSLTSITLKKGLLYVNKIVVFNDISISCIQNIGVKEFESHNLTFVSTLAFVGCSNLSKVTFDDKLKTIGSASFNECNLSRIAIPSSVTTIEDRAFKDNLSLSIVDLTSFTNPEVIPTLVEGSSVFSGCSSSLKFYVNDETMKNAFIKSSYWSTYSSKFTTDPVPSI